MPESTMTRAELLAAHCRPLDPAAALSVTALASTMGALADWQVVHDALVREFSFANYYETIAFVNALAFMVHREDHHPELEVSYSRCRVRFSTHSAGGITVNDLICAAKADAIFDQRYSGA